MVRQLSSLLVAEMLQLLKVSISKHVILDAELGKGLPAVDEACESLPETHHEPWENCILRSGGQRRRSPLPAANFNAAR
jgi:hypothetical protein